MSNCESYQRIGPDVPLPLPAGYTNVDKYVNDLLAFVSSSDIFRLLCGGVHILDFFACDPPLYEQLLDEDWRSWFAIHELSDVLEFILREDTSCIFDLARGKNSDLWRGLPPPPVTFAEYVLKIRQLTLSREVENSRPWSFSARHNESCVAIPRNIAVGMDDKKIHEVDRFACFVQNLSNKIVASTGTRINYFVDFGSGKNYLGRTLASKPYNKHVIAVESKHDNVVAAEALDMQAKLAPKSGVMRNKKEFRKYLKQRTKLEQRLRSEVLKDVIREDQARLKAMTVHEIDNVISDVVRDTSRDMSVQAVDRTTGRVNRAKLDLPEDGTGSVQHVVQKLEDGNLKSVIEEIADERDVSSNGESADTNDPNTAGHYNQSGGDKSSLMVMSIHSCGNLVHHGLRSLILNPSVKAVALVGCCYNLVTERLNPPTYKLPSLRGAWNGKPPEGLSEKLLRSAGGDPNGYPMSEHICKYQTRQGKGIHLNITARMMAVQVPMGWAGTTSADFFSRHFFRHFYRALLQKIFVDRGVVKPANAPINRAFNQGESENADQRSKYTEADPIVSDQVQDSANSTLHGGGTQPVIIGSLRKQAYANFPTYVRSAVEKLSATNNHHPSTASTDLPYTIRAKMADITDEEIVSYEAAYERQKKELSIVWTLMAYSAQLVEALIVVDRWLWLMEQEEVGPGRCWVEPVFDYSKSPRNLVVVGIKKSKVDGRVSS